MAATDATAIPIKNQAHRITFPIFDADGDLVATATGLDSEISKDAGTFADATNEATQIATASGMYFLDLTATEMNADTVAIIVKSTEGKTVPIVLYPCDAGDIPANVTHIGGVLQTGRDIGTSVLLSSGTGAGQVTLSGGRVAADAVYWNGAAVAAPDTAGHPKVTIKDGTGTGELDTNAGKVSIATGGIVAGSFASGAVDAAALAADAANEIRDAILAAVVETEGSYTVKQVQSILLSVLAGVTGTGGTVLKSPNGVATRVTATVNASNERTAMTLTPSA
jgi:hypothetical protein